MAVLSGVLLIDPLLTQVNAPDWKITPEIVLGKDALATRFSATAATATCPL